MQSNFLPKISKQRPFSAASSGVEHATAESLDALQRAFESDRGRIINSAALRRLQQKTQVFPLERNAAVRSRLTHSLEVQQVGRFIVQSIYKILGTRAKDYGLEGLNHQLESLVEMACLLHDIGNPPFGHLGETAISRWFAMHLPQMQPGATALPELQPIWLQICTELSHYEGNAQGIRIVASLQAMNLTYSQSACILKYTRPASLPKAEIPADFSYLMKKPGYYLTEQAFVEAQQQALGIAPYHRHPLTYIMEAADDISYCLADIEDAVEKGILSLAQVAALLKQHYGSYYPTQTAQQWPAIRSYRDGQRADSQNFADIIDSALRRSERHSDNQVYEFFIQLRVGCVHPLVQHAALQFIEHIDAVCDGSFNRALLEDNSPYHQISETFKAVALQHVFNHREVETLEIQGFQIISGLLEQFKPLLLLSSAEFALLLADKAGKTHPLEQRLVHRLPKKYLLQYQKALQQGLPQQWRQSQNPAQVQTLYEFYLRARLLQDHLGGMTDHFAADEYQALVLCR